MSVDILGTSCDQCRSTVQYSFTSPETRRLVGRTAQDVHLDSRFCGSRRDLEEGGGAGPTSQPKRDQEQGGGAGLES